MAPAAAAKRLDDPSDSVQECKSLQKEQRHRPSAHRMMEHPFLAAHDAARLTVVRDPGLGCELLQVKLTEEIVLSFVEHYYQTLRGVSRAIIAGLWVASFQRAPAMLARTGARHAP